MNQQQLDIANNPSAHLAFVQFLVNHPKYGEYFAYLTKSFARVSVKDGGMPMQLAYLDFLRSKLGESWLNNMVRTFRILSFSSEVIA